MKRILSFIPVILIICVLSLTFFSHGINLFRFPYLENDEGVYMSQAWSLLTKNELAPYTYWYDHAPIGWFSIALWVKLTGGFYTFGQSVMTGRVFMLVLQMLNTWFVFVIMRRITGAIIPACIAACVFSISPLSIYFHRRVLLDNIMTTYILASVTLILREKITLLDIFISGILVSLGVLSKENAIFFVPGLLLLIISRIPKPMRIMAIAGWIGVIGSIVSLYFLYAGLKGELFPYGSVLGGNKPHVSLLTTLSYQAQRKGPNIFDQESWTQTSNYFLWYQQDPIIILGGIVGGAITGIHVLWKTVRKKSRRFEITLLGILFCTLGFFYFLGRGGVVLEFYIVPLLPFLCLLLGIGVYIVTQWFQRFWWTYPILSIGCFVVLTALYLPFVTISKSFPQQNAEKNMYTTDQTKSQRDALTWIREHVDERETIIFDNHIYLDLKDPQNPGKKVYDRSHWYWKVDLDPEIRDDVYNNNPEAIDYVALTPQMNSDLLTGISPLTHTTISSGHLISAFNAEGWSVNIFRSTFPNQILQRSWTWYKTAYIKNGQVLDRSENNKTTSEGQSYALLRSVWMGDKETFSDVWNWTKKNLLLENNLFAWRHTDTFDVSTSGDNGTAPDANIDIALALLFAGKQWNNADYHNEATTIIRAIWNQEVGYIQGKPYLSAGNWAISPTEIIVNPSYFTPYAFRIFAQVTPDISWLELIDTGYTMIEQCTSAPLNVSQSLYLPPEWCGINVDGTVFLSDAAGISSSDYSYNAFRVPFRLAVDYQWYREPRAKSYLEKMNFLFDTWKNDNKLVAIYSHDGKPLAEYEAVAAYAGSLGAFMIHDEKTATDYYATKLRGRFYEVDGKSFWDDPDNYYTQNWGWFGTALYSGKIKNLWGR